MSRPKLGFSGSFLTKVTLSNDILADVAKAKEYMKTIITHHIDKSELDEDGMYDYYYEYDIYEFCENDLSYIARSYIDEPLEVHFLKKKSKNDSDWQILEKTDLKNSLFKNAVAYFRKNGKEQIRVLSKTGYKVM